jgi:flagellar biosynthetic protein FliQ
MSPEALLREGLAVTGTVGAPLFVALIVAGLVLGVLQASTQVNDPAVSTVPKLLVAAGVLWFLGGWMISRMAEFLAAAISHMGGMG